MNFLVTLLLGCAPTGTSPVVDSGEPDPVVVQPNRGRGDIETGDGTPLQVEGTANIYRFRATGSQCAPSSMMSVATGGFGGAFLSADPGLRSTTEVPPDEFFAWYSRDGGATFLRWYGGSYTGAWDGNTVSVQIDAAHICSGSDRPPNGPSCAPAGPAVVSWEWEADTGFVHCESAGSPSAFLDGATQEALCSGPADDTCL